MATTSASVSYKKKDGTLTISQDQKSISWIPAAGGAGSAITVPVQNITNLQQTAATNPKVMLRVFAQQTDGTQEQYVFTFTSGGNARTEADAIKDVLSGAIAAAKAASAPGPATSLTVGGSGAPISSNGEGVSAAMAMANAISSSGTGLSAWDNDDKLKADAELQQSLLKSDANLQRMFMESLRTRPETLSVGQFASQFWSSRVHLLRAHAIERTQMRGSYNVLSTLKPRTDNNVTKLNITKEQIQLIFNQHPLVKRVYDENVPKLSEEQFWSRFFQSKLFKKLRGERVSDSDATDAILDKYLKVDEHASRVRNTQVPHFIDLAGNEVNHSQKQGNRPDFDMRPASIEKVPIIRTLNALSESIMANVAPADGDPSAPIGMDEEAYNHLLLRDLKADEEQSRIKLNIRDQNRFFSQDKRRGDEEDKEKDSLLARRDPKEIIVSLQTDFDRTLPADGSFHLGKIVEPDEDEDEDEDEEEGGKARHVVGSKLNMQRASNEIFSVIRERRAQADVSSNTTTWGLSSTLFDRLSLTHATTTEFLNQFWNAFLSGNPDRAGELASLVESLSRAMERIKAVAADAEAEREKEVNKLKQHAREVFAATGKKIRVNLAGVRGGEKVVNQLLSPTVAALKLAVERYQSALAEATAASAREDSLAL